MDDEAAELIEVYFTLEEPAERDAVFDRLAALDSPLAAEFFAQMMEHDEDEHLRGAAAAVLARGGDEKALALLETDLDEPVDISLFEHAVKVLVEIKGPAFYDRLVAIWRDVERDLDERREAMLGMESVDPSRALSDFTAFLDATIDVAALPDDQVELAIMTFIRNNYAQAIPSLEGLRQRIAAAELDPDERAELVGMVDEGIALLRE